MAVEMFSWPTLQERITGRRDRVGRQGSLLFKEINIGYP